MKVRTPIYICIALLALTASCSSKQPTVIREYVTETVTEVVHDTIIDIVPDKSTLQALIECREGKPVIKEIVSEKKGASNLEPPKVHIEDSILTVDCETRAQELFLEWKSKHTQKEIQIPVEVNRLTFWQEVQINLGRALLLLAGIITIVQIIKRR